MGLGLVLMVYTSFRTLNLFQRQLPPDQQLLAVVALGAFDVALLGWAWYYRDGAKSDTQRSIAIGMFLVSLAAVFIAVLGDSMITSSENGMVTQLGPEMMKWIVIATVGIVMMNVAAALITHMVDPDRRHEQNIEATEQLVMEEANRSLRTQSRHLAAEIAPVVAQTMLGDLRARIMSDLQNYGVNEGGEDSEDQQSQVRVIGARRRRISSVFGKTAPAGVLSPGEPISDQLSQAIRQAMEEKTSGGDRQSTPLDRK